MSFFPLLYTWSFVTGRNEVVAKVIFLPLSVILFTEGGVCLSACWDTTHPQEQTTPPEQTPPKQTPPKQTPPQADTTSGADTLQSRHPQGADTPPRADTPLEQTPPPPPAPPPPGSRLQHTVNERPVRILLECILVVHRSTCYTGQFSSIVCRLSMRSTPECFCLR